MAKTWKAGVIGCGAIAHALHLPGYAKCRGVSLVAICDPVRERQEEAKRFGKELRIYDDYRKMLKAEELDVVSVASPNCYHAAQACAALEAGAHVLLEKPAALSMKEVAQIRKAVTKSGRQLIVGFSQRFARGPQRVNQMVKAGIIGEPYMFRARLAHRGPYPGWARSDWFYKPKLAGGGVLLDMGVHMIDQAMWHLGPIRSVQAVARTLRKPIAVDDNAVLLLEFARSRAVGYIEVSWTSPAGFVGIEIMGDKGWILNDYTRGLMVTTGKTTPDQKARAKFKTRLVDKNPGHGGWSVEVGEVVKAFRKRSNLEAGIAAGGAAVAVALAAYESSRTGRRVAVRY